MRRDWAIRSPFLLPMHTARETGGRSLSGSNPSAMSPKKKGPHRWEPIKSVVGDEGCRVRLAPPAFASSLRSSRAALENASRFLSSAPLRVRIPLRWAQKERLPLLTAFSIKVVGDEGCRVRLRRPLSLRRFAPCVLRWKTLARFLSSAPCRVRIPLHWALKRKAPIAGGLSIQVVGDEGCRVRLRRPLPLRRWRALRAALENASRFLSSAPLRVRIPLRWAQKERLPLLTAFSIKVVGDEGFEPPALCV